MQAITIPSQFQQTIDTTWVGSRASQLSTAIVEVPWNKTRRMELGHDRIELGAPQLELGRSSSSQQGLIIGQEAAWEVVEWLQAAPVQES